VEQYGRGPLCPYCTTELVYHFEVKRLHWDKSKWNKWHTISLLRYKSRCNLRL